MVGIVRYPLIPRPPGPLLMRSLRPRSAASFVDSQTIKPAFARHFGKVFPHREAGERHGNNNPSAMAVMAAMGTASGATVDQLREWFTTIAQPHFRGLSAVDIRSATELSTGYLLGSGVDV